MRLWYLVLLFCFVGSIAAKDVSGQTIQIPKGRKLPPSLEAELRQRKSKIRRTIVFRDTVFGSARLRAAFNDAKFNPNLEEVSFSDSARSVVDTGLNLSHQEWLDSQAVEIPEITHLRSGTRFLYSASSIIPSLRQQVPFDTSLLAGMNPISRESLPYFDESPIPSPLAPITLRQGLLDVAGGNVRLPSVKLFYGGTLGNSTTLSADGQYIRNSSASAVQGFWNARLSGDFALGEDPAVEAFRTATVQVTGQAASKNTSLDSGEHTLQNYSFSSGIHGNETDAFYYSVRGIYNSFEDQAAAEKLSESDGLLSAKAYMNFGPGDYRIQAETELASTSGLLIPAASGIPNSGFSLEDLRYYSLKALVGKRATKVLEWFAGAAFIDTRQQGASRTVILPVVRFRFPLNARWEIGGSFEPRVEQQNARALGAANSFYYLPDVYGNRLIAEEFRSNVIEKINLTAYTSYTLSPDDELRGYARYIERTDEPIFLSPAPSTFVLALRDTRRFIFGGAMNLLLFKHDVATMTAEVQSASIKDYESAIPFAPVLNFSLRYAFNTISDLFYPAIEYRYLGRNDASFSFLNLDLAFHLSSSLEASIRGENLLGSRSDYWEGFPENPRNVGASISYSF